MEVYREKCPNCGTSPCHIPFLAGGKIECSNPQCKLYSEDLYPRPKTEEKTDKSNHPAQDDGVSYESVDGPVYLWSTHHNDFGDV